MNDEASALIAYEESAAPEAAAEYELASGALAARALECLEELDDAREGLRTLFLQLARRCYPLGSPIDLDRFSVMVGDRRAAALARVRGHQVPAIDLARPELTAVVLECATLHADGRESGNVVWVKAYLLDRHEATDPASDRKHLLEMVRDLEAGSRAESLRAVAA